MLITYLCHALNRLLSSDCRASRVFSSVLSIFTNFCHVFVRTRYSISFSASSKTPIANPSRTTPFAPPRGRTPGCDEKIGSSFSKVACLSHSVVPESSLSKRTAYIRPVVSVSGRPTGFWEFLLSLLSLGVAGEKILSSFSRILCEMLMGNSATRSSINEL